MALLLTSRPPQGPAPAGPAPRRALHMFDILCLVLVLVDASIAAYFAVKFIRGSVR